MFISLVDDKNCILSVIILILISFKVIFISKQTISNDATADVGQGHAESEARIAIDLRGMDSPRSRKSCGHGPASKRLRLCKITKILIRDSQKMINFAVAFIIPLAYRDEDNLLHGK